MVSYGDVRKWDAAPLHQAVGRLNTLCTTVEGLSDEVDDAGRTSRWHGEAAAGAATTLRRVRTGMADFVSEVAAMRTAMGSAADAVDGLKTAVTETESLANYHTIRIEDNGTLRDTVKRTFPSEEAKAEWEADQNRVKAELSDRVEQIVRRADDIDFDLNKVITRCLSIGGVGNREYDGLTEAARAGDDAGRLSTIGPPPDGTAAANAAWYASLGENEKAWILANKPEMIGNLDGVPAAVRHDANVARVETERTRLQAERDAYLADPKNRYVDANGYYGVKHSAEFDRINAKLAALEAIDLTLEKDDRQLLVLDLTGERAKAAIAIGEVDDADHVAVFTPGMNSTVEGSIDGYDEDMNELRDKTVDELRSAGRMGESVAVVTWLNYEPPNMDINPASGLSDSKAYEGAARLAPFLEGINALQPDDPHLTALGHSYGSLTTGIALRDHATGVDEMAVFGSPGLQVDNASQLHVPEGHAYNMQAEGDWLVADGAPIIHGPDVSDVPGIKQLSTDAYSAPDGRHLEAAYGHSEYLRAGDKDTTTEWNLANIIAGTGRTR